MLLSVTEGNNHPCAGHARFVCVFVRCSAAAGWSRSSTRSSAITCEHLEDDYIAAGMAPGDARYAARREMGAIEQRKEECRDARGLALLDSVRQDVGIRAARAPQEPGFHRGRDPVARPRHRREHDHLHVRQCRPPPAVAVSRLGPAGDSARAAARRRRHGQRPPAELPRVARPRAFVRGARAGADSPAQRDRQQRRRTDLRGSRRHRSSFASSAWLRRWAVRSPKRRRGRAGTRSSSSATASGSGGLAATLASSDDGWRCREVRSRSSASRLRDFESA